MFFKLSILSSSEEKNDMTYGATTSNLSGKLTQCLVYKANLMLMDYKVKELKNSKKKGKEKQQ